MNTIKTTILIKTIFKDTQCSSNYTHKTIEAELKSTYEDFFLDIIKNSETIDLNKNFEVFLQTKDGEKLAVNVTNYNQIRERVLTRS